MDPVKVQGVTDWLQPVKVKDVQSFIGFMNFYQRFICNFSKITHPLHVLTWKSKDWSWGAAEQQAFDTLKNAVTSAPTLAFPSRSSVGGIMVLCVTRLYKPVLALRTSQSLQVRNPTTGMLF